MAVKRLEELELKRKLEEEARKKKIQQAVRRFSAFTSVGLAVQRIMFVVIRLIFDFSCLYLFFCLQPKEEEKRQQELLAKKAEEEELKARKLAEVRRALELDRERLAAAERFDIVLNGYKGAAL